MQQNRVLLRKSTISALTSGCKPNGWKNCISSSLAGDFMPNKPLRILHILGTDFAKGGVEQYILNSHHYIDKSRINFDILSPYFIHLDDKAGELQQFKANGGHMFALETKFRGLRHFNVIIDCRAIFTGVCRFLREHQDEYDALHIQTEGAPIIAVISLAAKHMGMPCVIAHSHGALGMRSKIYNSIKFGISAPLINRNVDFRFACSKSAGEYTFGKKYPVTVQQNGIDTKRFAFNPTKREQRRRKLHIEDKFVLGNIGRFNIQKNHQFLLDVFAAVKKRERNSILLMVGGGEMEEILRKKVKALGLENDVMFYGASERPEHLYQAMDVFVLPSLFEGLPLVAVEAQCAGLPTICSAAVTDEAKLTELFIQAKGSAEDWADVILQQKEGIEQRRSHHEAVALAGYDARVSAEKLLNSYLTALGLPEDYGIEEAAETNERETAPQSKSPANV
jgi:glycosyltransferase involved in cell wall biosynthesis